MFCILLFNSGLHEDEKAAIREKLLQAFVEPINQVSRVIVLAIVKKIMSKYKLVWENAISSQDFV